MTDLLLQDFTWLGVTIKAPSFVCPTCGARRGTLRCCLAHQIAEAERCASGATYMLGDYQLLVDAGNSTPELDAEAGWVRALAHSANDTAARLTATLHVLERLDL